MSERQPTYRAYIDWHGHGGLAIGLGGWHTTVTPQSEIVLSDEQTFVGNHSLRITNPAAIAPVLRTFVAPADVQCTVRTWVYNPSSSDNPAISMEVSSELEGIVGGTSSSVKDEWVELSYSFTLANQSRVTIIVGRGGSTSDNSPWYLGWASVVTPDDDVSCDVLATRQVPDIVVGRDSARDLSEIRSGEVSLELKNDQGQYTPGAGTIGDRVVLGRQILLSAEIDGQMFPLYSGYVESFDLHASLDEQSVSLQCSDLIHQLSQVTISTPLFESVRTGDAVREVLKAAGMYDTLNPEIFTPGDHVVVDPYIDHGGTTLTWWTFSGDAKAALDEILESEGSPSLYTVGTSNQIVFWDRHHRVRPEHGGASFSVVSCFPDDPPDTFVMHDSSVPSYGWDTMFNRVKMAYSSSAPEDAISTVWNDTETSRNINGRETITVSVDGFIDGIEPVPGYRVLSENEADGYETNINIDVLPEEYDFIVESGTVTVEDFKSSGSHVSITLAGIGTVSGLSMRGRAVGTETGTSDHNDTGSQVHYNLTREIDYDAHAASRHDATDIALWLLRQNSSPRPFATIVMKNHSLDYTRMMLGTGLSDSFGIDAFQWNIDQEFAVEGLKHRAGELGKDHELTIYAQQSDPVGFEQNLFTFDVDGKGFNLGVFAQFADEPFTFGESGRGFGDGAFGYQEHTNQPFILGTSELDGTDEIWY